MAGGGCVPALTPAAPNFLPPTLSEPRALARIHQLRERQPVKINYNIYLTENTASVWETVVDGRTLYLRVPTVLGSGSKESFVALLEHAEEQLACSRVVLAVKRSRADRAALVRTFMFMGFQPLRADAPALNEARFSVPDPADHIFLLYTID